MKPEEREYLNLVHKVHEKHGIQTKIFSLIPIAVAYHLFNGHCDICQQKLRSRPMYILKIPRLERFQIKYLCSYCAKLHEKYIRFLIITKN